MWGPLPISMVLRSEGSPGALASQLGTMLEQKKKKTTKKKTNKKKKKKDGKYNINIRVAGKVV